MRPIPNCKECSIKRVQEWKAEFPERYLAINERRNRRNRERGVAAIGREPIRCDICGESFSGKSGLLGPAFDHNHETGEARGWLYPSCNKAIGALGDNPRLLRAAAEYLESRGHYATKTVLK